MGISFATLRTLPSQTFPPKSKFSTDQIPDLTGRVAIVTGTIIAFLKPNPRSHNSAALCVTGGNVGVGKETVKVCAGTCYGHEQRII